ncbi:hypothetical protein CTAYLR_008482 [Chrysophaeum taylorii]|uniref:Sulfatase N-terminal domain-containing protein n=1 Tax=Chrysophaeum taylorii TaxID=2483200 RepID=A0AAD7UB14_9STRA|nr:hypothetical protein CTAYLR_008482 [Chrysophaeum taylorii]
MLVLFAACSAAAKSAAAKSAAAKSAEFRSIVWLLVDDLRPQTYSYGQGEMWTPNLDALARESVVFERAYCQLTVCSPSRNSFLTGRRPDSLRVWNFETHFRETTRNAMSLPEYLKRWGYETFGSGKTFQPNKPPEYDGKRSWDHYLPLVKNQTWCSRKYRQKQLDVCPEPRIPERQFMDRAIADYSASKIEKAKRPFFVVAGFYRPHLHWVMPQKFYDLYDDVDLKALEFSKRKPRDMPDVAWTNEGCHTLTTQATGTHVIDMNVPLADDVTSELRRGYFACVTWIDYLCGRVLEKTPDDAIVVVSSDHGFHLGEQASWTKHTLFELSARVPLMVRAKGLLEPRVQHTQFVELVDVFRTVVHLAGLPPPPDTAVQGTPLFFDDRARKNFSYALTQYPRCPRGGSIRETNCKRVPGNKIPVMGYSLRVDGYRFTEWYRWTPALAIEPTAPPVATELYAYHEDRLADFDALEVKNIAKDHPCAVPHFRAALHLAVLSCQHARGGGGGGGKDDCDAALARIVGRASRIVETRQSSASCAPNEQTNLQH